MVLGTCGGGFKKCTGTSEGKGSNRMCVTTGLLKCGSSGMLSQRTCICIIGGLSDF